VRDGSFNFVEGEHEEDFKINLFQQAGEVKSVQGAKFAIIGPGK
jgi:hypothetical protein